MKKFAFDFLPYFDLLFLFEALIFIMKSSFIFGRLFTIIAGIILFILVTGCAIAQYFYYYKIRFIQLIVFDLYIAIVLPSIVISTVFSGLSGFPENAIYVYRLFICCLSFYYVLLLTDKDIIYVYTKQ